MPVNEIVNQMHPFVSDTNYNKNNIENVWSSLKS